MNTIDHSTWKARFEDASTRIQDRVRNLWRSLARDPQRLQRLQMGIIVLLVLWSLSSVSKLIWIPFRANPIDAAPALARGRHGRGRDDRRGRQRRRARGVRGPRLA